ncbi:Uncharacterized protein APZ42_011831 [Daphnia magna]|uniref:Uncharacterized protein n=1 Tax=Daphnia magna TaxID=35525 RepID=A0A162SGG9_9CRUS|nr:Uncharacterized protein APZ42_011831 [Daphnia magna]
MVIRIPAAADNIISHLSLFCTIVAVIETMDSVVMSGDLLSEISRNPIRDVRQSCR